MSELVEKVARAVREETVRQYRDEDIRKCSAGTSFFEEEVGPALVAQAAIAVVLDTVEAHLSAVQYDPAPYTALKHRLAQLRREALG